MHTSVSLKDSNYIYLVKIPLHEGANAGLQLLLENSKSKKGHN